jgi:hypothetical protein
MAFPTSPTNGQTVVVNNVSYQYSNVSNAWTRILSTANIITANTIASNGNISAAGNIITGNYFIGNGSLLTGIATGSSTSISNGTSNVAVVSSGGNIRVNVGGTSNVIVYATTGEYVTGIVSASGNIISAGNVTGGNILTGGLISATGTLSVSGATTLANLSAGNISSGGISSGGAISAAGNITGGNLSGTNIVGTLTTASQTNITSVGTLGSLAVTANVTGGNLLTGGLVSAAGTITGTSHLGAVVSVTANVTGGNLLTGGLISATSTITSAANITGGNVLTGGLISATANVTANNGMFTNIVNVASHTGAVVSVSGNVTGGNVLTGGLISATANITGGNLLTAGQISATGTITSNAATNSTAFAVGNSAVSNVALGMFPTAGTAGEYAIRDYSNVFTNMYLDVGIGGTANGAFKFRTTNAFTTLANINSTGITTPLAVSATGNITGSYFIGNGSQLTGISGGGGSSITNGTSNVVVAASGNVTVGIAGTAAVATFYTAGIIANSIAATNNGGAYNFKVGDDAWLGDINTADTIGIRGQQNNANGYIVFGNADSSTKLGRSGSGPLTYEAAFSATGNVTGGNLLTSGLVSAAGTITGTSHLGSVVSVTANITGGNILTGGLMSSTGNAIHSNVIINGTAAAGSGVLIVSGNIQTSTANATANIGNASNYFNRLFAQATTALYADLAEVYKADAQYPPGTVVVFGGNQEVTTSTVSHDAKIAGVVSTHPAHVMNSGLQSEFTVEVGLIGRVPCQVIGPIAAGDRVVSSNRAGVAERLDMSKYQPGVIIGKAVESYSGLDVGTIEVVVGRL